MKSNKGTNENVTAELLMFLNRIVITWVVAIWNLDAHSKWNQTSHALFINYVVCPRIAVVTTNWTINYFIIATQFTEALRWAKHLQVQINWHALDSFHPIYYTSFPSAFELPCDTIGIYEWSILWILYFVGKWWQLLRSEPASHCCQNHTNVGKRVLWPHAV